MNKYLLMSAAALLGTASPVYAGDQSKLHVIHFSSQGSYCNYLSFQSVGQGHATGTDINYDCNGNGNRMMGTVDRKAFHLFETVDSANVLFDIYKPIRDGGTYDVWICTSFTCFDVGAGTYFLGPPGKAPGHKSIKANVARMIAEFKATRERKGQ